MTSVSASQKLVAEALGTSLLLATVVGSGIMAERLADGNAALALLGNTLPTGAILVVLITMMAPISGAHFNPAVSWVFFLRRELSARSAFLYTAAQVGGAIFGVVVAHAMFGEPLLQISGKARSGFSQNLSEGVATFGLVVTILLTQRAKPAAVPVSVGLYITAAYWFTASTSFANPAVTIARSLSDTFSGIQPSDLLGFIVAQMIGATCGFLVARTLAPVDARPLPG